MLKQSPESAKRVAAVMLACLLLPVNALAMRCGTALISKGDIQAKVLKYCGEPVQANRRYGLRTGFSAGKHLSISGASSMVAGTGYYPQYVRYEVIAEEWIFNLGPNRLMRLITFENGIVVDVDTLNYGYTE